MIANIPALRGISSAENPRVSSVKHPLTAPQEDMTQYIITPPKRQP